MRGAFAVAGLQHVQFAAFDREFHVLHVFVVFFKRFGNRVELVVKRLVVFFEFSDRLRGADAGNDVFALGVEQIFAIQNVFAIRRVAREGNAGAAVVAHVAEDHRLNGDRCAPFVRNVVQAAIGIGPRIIPRTENRLHGADQLDFRILRERFAFELGVFFQIVFDELFQIVGIEIGVVRRAFFVFRRFQNVFEVVFVDFHDDIGEHLDEATIRVVSKTRIVGQFREAFDGDVIQAEVQNRVHHSGHRNACAGANGNEERICVVAKGFADDFFSFMKRAEDLILDFLTDLFPVLIVLRASFGGDGESRRNRHSDCSHVAKVCAFTAKQVFQSERALFE